MLNKILLSIYKIIFIGKEEYNIILNIKEFNNKINQALLLLLLLFKSNIFIENKSCI